MLSKKNKDLEEKILSEKLLKAECNPFQLMKGKKQTGLPNVSKAEINRHFETRRYI